MSSTQQLPVRDLFRLIAQAPEVRCQAWFVQDSTTWTCAYGRIWTGAFERVETRDWRYANDLFVDDVIPGRVAVALLKGQRAALHGHDVSSGALAPMATVQRLPGSRLWRYLRTSRPRVDWELYAAERTAPSTQGDLLVGAGPSFVGRAAAVEAFFGIPANEATQVPTSLWNVIAIQRCAYFEEVRISVTGATCAVGGPRGRGVALEVSAGGESMHMIPLRSKREIEFDLPGGLAPRTLFALRRGDAWLDYRFFDSESLGRGFGDPSVVWVQPQSELELLTSMGEGTAVEYKSQLPADESPKKNLLKTVAAFASGAGGVILLGVDDSGAIVGLEGISEDEITRRLTDMIRNRVSPEPDYAIRFVLAGKRLVALLDVRSGGRWYVFNPQAPEFYVRRGASTMRARAEEVLPALSGTQPSWEQFWR